MNLALPRQGMQRRSGGFSLVELLVAMSLGLILIIAVLSVYLSSKNAFRRTEELGAIQNGARTAFEYLSFDSRMAGMLGCQAGASPLPPAITTSSMLSDYQVPVEGYDANVDASFAATGSTDNTKWTTNTATPGGTAQVVFNATGTGLPNAISLGSDILILRGPATATPLRLTETANAGASQTTLKVESTTVAGSHCQNNSTAASGLCTGSHVLVANCQNSKVVEVSSVAAPASGASAVTLTLTNPGMTGATPFEIKRSEAFPMQTVVYYVAPSDNNTSTHSLYRHVFNGTKNTAGERQELIEGVENMQITYGEDNSPTDSTVDVYRTADEVVNWANVMSIRMGLLIRPLEPMAPDAASPASAVVNGASAVTFPNTRFDRRVFTSTVALRNKIPFSAAP